MIGRVVVLLAFAQAAQTCSHRDTALTLDAIRPDSVLMRSGAVVEVVLHGHGFAPGAPGQNTVIFASREMNNIPANDDGTQIRFVIPETMPSGGGAAPLPIDAGAYEVRVRAGGVESNVGTVRVFR